MTTLKAVLIDPFTKTCTDFTVSKANAAAEIKAAAGIGLFDLVPISNKPGRRAALVVDDEGLFKEGQKFFCVRQGDHFTSAPLAGKAVCIGLTRDGDFADSPFNAAINRAVIGWMEGAAVRAFRDSGGFDSRVSAIGPDLQPTGPVTVIPVRPEVED